MIKKIMAVLVSISILIMISPIQTFANENDFVSLISTLQMLELQKENYGLENVEFEQIEVGEKIHVYDFKDDQFIESRYAYPLFFNDELVAIAYSIGNSQFQLMNGLVEKICQFDCNEVAIIYDYVGCHIYNGETFELIGETSIRDTNKDTLPIDLSGLEFNRIVLSDFSEREILGYTSSVQMRVPIYYTCPVSYVTQHPYANLCWAASIACIANYRLGDSYTASDIAQAYFDSDTDFNQGLYSDDAAIVLSNLVGQYTFREQHPSDSCILTNIQNRYPIYGQFRWIAGDKGGMHIATIYGYALSGNGYISVMDPEFGSVMVQKNDYGYYRYVSSYSGVTLTLQWAACHSWE